MLCGQDRTVCLQGLTRATPAKAGHTPATRGGGAAVEGSPRFPINSHERSLPAESRGGASREDFGLLLSQPNAAQQRDAADGPAGHAPCCLGSAPHLLEGSGARRAPVSSRRLRAALASHRIGIQDRCRSPQGPADAARPGRGRMPWRSHAPRRRRPDNLLTRAAWAPQSNHHGTSPGNHTSVS